MIKYFKTDTIVTGYHGCHLDVKTRLLDREIPFLPSEKEYDWLGKGIYFWEKDDLRAKKWADKYHGKNGCVIGANIKLGVCFDISLYYTKQILKEMYDAFIFEAQIAKVPIPANKSPKSYIGHPDDKILRYLDRAVLDYTFSTLRKEGVNFDTVRAPFQEGNPIYQGSSFREYDHIHLCVQNSNNIELFDPDLL